MSVQWGNDGSARSGMRRRLREARERDRRLTMRHRWYAGGIATLLSGALIFTGVTPALAEEPPTPAPSATTEATPPRGGDHTPRGGDAGRAGTVRPGARTRGARAGPGAVRGDGGAFRAAGREPKRTTEDGRAADRRFAVAARAGGGCRHRRAVGADPGLRRGRHHGEGRIGPHRHHGRHQPHGRHAAAQHRHQLARAARAPTAWRARATAGPSASPTRRATVRSSSRTRRQHGGANRDARYWVVQSGVPAGYYTNPVLRVGGASGAGDPLAYTFRTGAQLRANTDVLVAGRQRLHAVVRHRRQRVGRHLAAVAQQPDARPVLWPRRRADPRHLGLGGRRAPEPEAGGQHLRRLPRWERRRGCRSSPSRWQTPALGRHRQNYPDLISVSTAAQGTAFKNRYAGWNSAGGDQLGPRPRRRGLGEHRSQQLRRRGRHHRRQPDHLQPAVPGQRNQQPLPRDRERHLLGERAEAGPAAAATRVLAFGVGARCDRRGERRSTCARSPGRPPTTAATARSRTTSRRPTTPSAGTALRNLALGNCQGTLTVTKQIVPQHGSGGLDRRRRAGGRGMAVHGRRRTPPG